MDARYIWHTNPSRRPRSFRMTSLVYQLYRVGWQAIPIMVLITFLIVVVGWVFFRASNLTRAIDYLASMFGFGHAPPGAALVSGIIYQPYYLLSIAVAGLVVWAGAQTWDWTQRLTLPKVALCFVLAWLAVAVARRFRVS